MRIRRTIAAALSVLALTAVAACGTPGLPATAGHQGGPQLPSYPVRTDVKLDGSPVWTAARKRDKLIIGAKADQPYLGYEDVSANTWTGFDIEIAKMVAADLGFSPDKIEWKTVNSADRENKISDGTVDYFVGTYSATPDRKKSVSFAGPYYLAGQDLLVRASNTAVTGPDSLRGKNVCTAVGSTSIGQIKDYLGKDPITYNTYGECVDKLLTDEIDAVTTDDAILKGYAAKHPGKLKVVGKPFSVEKYSVGLTKEDKVLRDAINNALKAHEDNGDWKKAYDATLGLSGSPAPQIPPLDRY